MFFNFLDNKKYKINKKKFWWKKKRGLIRFVLITVFCESQHTKKEGFLFKGKSFLWKIENHCRCKKNIFAYFLVGLTNHDSWFQKNLVFFVILFLQKNHFKFFACLWNHLRSFCTILNRFWRRRKETSVFRFDWTFSKLQTIGGK